MVMVINRTESLNVQHTAIFFLAIKDNSKITNLTTKKDTQLTK